MSNFEKLKVTFQQETGQAWNNNIATYVAYYQAKILEDFVQAYYTKNGIVKR